MNCNNNKHSSKNILFIGIIIMLIGGYLYTNHSAWLASAAPLLLLVLPTYDVNEGMCE